MIATKYRGIGQLYCLIFLTLWWSTWILLLPLLDEHNSIHCYFPPRYYGLAIPATILIAGVSLLMLIAGILMVTPTKSLPVLDRILSNHPTLF